MPDTLWYPAGTNAEPQISYELEPGKNPGNGRYVPPPDSVPSLVPPTVLDFPPGTVVHK